MIKAIAIIIGTLAIISIITAFLVGVFGYSINNDATPIAEKTETVIEEEEEEEEDKKVETLDIPMKNMLKRITKKPFGIKVSPNNSSVQPEKFSGFHTGTDFEIFEDEIEKDIEVKAICDGEIIQKNSVSGYGGVIVQKCQYENDPITVLYGHIDLSSSTKETQIKKGDLIALLSPANSQESGFERKHLHLGIIKGNQINYRGYVQLEEELSSWINPIIVLQKELR